MSRRTILWVAFFVTVQGAFMLWARGDASMAGPLGLEGIEFDVRVYREHAQKFWIRHQVPWRDYVVEYPPAAFPLFVLPQMLTRDQRTYYDIFALQVVALNVALTAALASWIERRDGASRVPWRLAWASACLALCCPWITARFDLLPAWLAFVGACLWLRGRSGRGGVWVGLGTLAKVWPAVIVLPLALADRLGRRARTGLMTWFVTLAIGFAMWVEIAGLGVKASIARQAGRGAEICSIYAGIALEAGRLAGRPVKIAFESSAVHVHSTLADTLARWSPAFMAIALALVMCRAWRNASAAPMRYCAAAVIALTATGKILSPQYLLWIYPFAASAEGRAGRVLRLMFLLVLVLSRELFPHLYLPLTNQYPPVIRLLNARNTLLLAMLVPALWSAPRTPERAKSKDKPGRSPA